MTQWSKKSYEEEEEEEMEKEKEKDRSKWHTTVMSVELHLCHRKKLREAVGLGEIKKQSRVAEGWCLRSMKSHGLTSLCRTFENNIKLLIISGMIYNMVQKNSCKQSISVQERKAKREGNEMRCVSLYWRMMMH